MCLGDVVDQLLDQHRLADAGAAEEADLAATGVGREQVDDLDAGDQDLRFGRLVDIGRGRLVDGAALLGLDRAGFVHRLADDVHDAAEGLLADRHRDRLAGVGDFLVADEALGGVHRHGADGVLAEMLGDLEDEPVAVVVGLERVQDRRQGALELHVDDGAGHLGDAPEDALDVGVVCGLGHVLSLRRQIGRHGVRRGDRSSCADCVCRGRSAM